MGSTDWDRERRGLERVRTGSPGDATPGCYGPSVAIDGAALAPAAAGAAPVPIRSMLSPFRYGGGDPTTRLASTEFVRATFTPDGPGTVRIRWTPSGHQVDVQAWGPGGAWLEAAATPMLGGWDTPVWFDDAHPLILRAQHRHPGVRLTASGDLYHELLPTVIAQRITAGEAARQWRVLCRRLGDPAPGPFPGLVLPPAPERLASMPSWWFHPIGIERKRAEPLIEIARHADKLWTWAALGPAGAAAALAHLRGIGEWTIGLALAVALGEPDAIAVGDYHLKNFVAWNLAGEPRATDERMLELLAPYRGQRGRVVRLLHCEGQRPPAFGPRRRILPMHRW